MTKLSLLFIVTLLKHKDPTPKVKHHWGYDGDDGPAFWTKHYEICGRQRQSPIDISERQLTYEPGLSRFQLYNFHDYSHPSGTSFLNVTNNGHSASCKVKGDYYVDGGGLGGRYLTAEFHFHWGSVSSRGSEHAFNGRKFPLEMHIVHYAQKYGNISTAMKKPDGLAVLGVFFEISEKDNPHLEPVIRALGRIIHNGDHEAVENCQMRSLLPEDLGSFYRYEGSLTTPPCYESVIWTVFAETQTISERQMNTLRRLEQHQHHTHGPKGQEVMGRKNMVDNFRPLQPLHKRRVLKSFQGRFVKPGIPSIRFPSPPVSGPVYVQPETSVHTSSAGSNVGRLKDPVTLLTQVQNAHKYSLIDSRANMKPEIAPNSHTDTKGAAHQIPPTFREQNTNVRIPSAETFGALQIKPTTSRPFVTLFNGPFVPPKPSVERAPMSQTHATPQSSVSQAGGESPNQYTRPGTGSRQIITSGALKMPPSSYQTQTYSAADPQHRVNPGTSSQQQAHSGGKTQTQNPHNPGQARPPQQQYVQPGSHPYNNQPASANPQPINARPHSHPQMNAGSNIQQPMNSQQTNVRQNTHQPIQRPSVNQPVNSRNIQSPQPAQPPLHQASAPGPVLSHMVMSQPAARNTQQMPNYANPAAPQYHNQPLPQPAPAQNPPFTQYPQPYQYNPPPPPQAQAIHQAPPPVYLQTAPQPVRVQSSYYYDYYMHNNSPPAPAANPNYQTSNFSGFNYGAVGEVKRRKRRSRTTS